MKLPFLALLICPILLFGADREVINIGTSPNDGTGDSPRVAFEKVNNNFEALFNGTAAVTDPAAWRAEIRAAAFVNTLPELLALTGTAQTNVVVMLGRNTKGDGAAGVFYWDPASVVSTNLGTVYSHVGDWSTGRWHRVYSDPVDVRWFSDGQGDDTLAIQGAIDLLASTRGGTVFFSGMTSIISAPLTFTGNAEVTLAGVSSFNSLQSTNLGTMIKLGNGADCDMLVKEIGGRLNIKGIVFDGNRANQTDTNLHGIWLVGTNTQTERVTIENCVIQSISGIGLQNDNRETWLRQVHVRDCLSDGIRNTASSDTFWYDLLVGFNYGNGIAHIGVPGTGAGVAHMIGGNIFRNGQNGLWFTNSANNTVVDYYVDANNQNGILLEGPSWRNTFVSSRPVVNNYPTWVDGTATPYASGTYSNVRVAGTNAVGLSFIGCNFFQYESTLTHKPLYQIEDLRTGDYTNYQGMAFPACNFAEGAWTESTVPYVITNMWANATGEWMLDGVRSYNRYSDMIDIVTDDLRAKDQIEAAVGVQMNAYYSSALSGWLTRSNGPAFYLSGRYDDPILRLYYASTNTGETPLIWTNGISLNSTNGYVGIGRDPTLVFFDVAGKTRTEAVETVDGLSANAYYDGSWKYRGDGFAYFLQAQSTFSNLVLNVAATGLADGAVTFIPALEARETGRVSFPNDVEEHTVFGDDAILSLQNLTTNEPNYIAFENYLGAANRGTIGFSVGASPTVFVLNNNDLGGFRFQDTSGAIFTGPVTATTTINFTNGAAIYRDGVQYVATDSALWYWFKGISMRVNSYLSGGADLILTSGNETTETGRIDAATGDITTSGTLRLATSGPPASAGAAGLPGQVQWDADYVYVCVATNTWKRSALSTWP